MLISEMHVEIDVLLQKVSSFQTKNFLPQEIDIFINREIIKFIKTRIKANSNIKGEGAYDSIKRIEDLNSIVVEKELLVHYPLNQKEVEILLPFNFLGYIASDVNKGCKKVLSNNVNNVVEVVSTEYITQFSPIGNSVGTDLSTLASNYTISYESLTESIVLFSMSMIPEGYFPTDGIPSYRKVFIYNNIIANIVRYNCEANNLEFKFNKNTNKFVIKSKDLHNISVLNNETTVTTNSIASINPIKTLVDYHSSPVRILDREFKYKMKNSYLSSSNGDSVIGTLNETDIKIIPAKNLYYNLLNLTYYKRPREVNLSLGISSDLPDNALIEVVNNVARVIKNVIGDEGYQNYVRENSLIE